MKFHQYTDVTHPVLEVLNRCMLAIFNEQDNQSSADGGAGGGWPACSGWGCTPCLASFYLLGDTVFSFKQCPLDTYGTVCLSPAPSGQR